jgi:serine/threonine protein kinase
MLKSSNNIYLVYEYLNGGSLEKMLEDRGRLPESEAKNIIFGVFKGFKTLFNEKIIHRNLNPKNLYFNDGIVKVKNFFCCKSPIS